MKLSHQTLVVPTTALLILLALGLDTARPAEDKEKEEAAPWRLATDARAAVQLQAAADFIQDEDWKSAIRFLQHLLDGEPDTLARLGGRDGKPERTVSVHAEAERLLASLPEAGRRAYQQTYGPRAVDLLDVARTVHDDDLYARVVERYLFTDAGPAALRELARRHYNKGRLVLAALAYARLLQHVGPARWTSDDLYQAAVAFHHCRTSTSTDRMLKQLLSRNGHDIVRLGKQKLTVEALRQEIERVAPSSKLLQWPVYRGDAARGNRGAGEPPFLEALWRQSMFYEHGNTETANASKRLLRQAEKKLQEAREPIISAFSLIALTVRNHRGEMKPLLLYKSYFGVTAVDPRDGSLAWISPSSGSLQRMLSSTRAKATVVGQWLNNYERQYPQMLFENSTVGTLSTDGEFVYVVEDLAIPPPPLLGFGHRNRFPGGIEGEIGTRKPLPRRDTGDAIRIRTAPSPYDVSPRPRPSKAMFTGLPLDKDVEDSVAHNRLLALSLARSGALTWDLGEDEKDPLHDHFFLGPPLPLDGLLYVLVQKERQVALLCLDPHVRKGQIRQPRIVFKKPLVEIATSLLEDPIRRTHAAHLASADGILVCPINAGVVLGVDVLDNRLMWAYPYGDKSDATEKPDRGNDRFGRRWPPPGFQIGPDGQLHPIRNNWNLWKVTAPVISDGKVVLAAPDSRAIHCLNLREGFLLWKHAKLADDLYLGNVSNGKVLIVGKKNVRALSLASGEILWTLETGMPSGQGIESGELYYLPLQRGSQSKQPEILVLDIDKGRMIAHNKTGARTPGNLVFVEGKLISQSPWEIVAYPPRSGK